MNPPPEATPAASIDRVLQGYTIYRVLLGLTYLGFVAIGGWASRTPPGLPDNAGPMGLAILIMGALGLLFVVATFFAPTRPWAWSAHGALICMGVPLCVTTPFALALGWTWLHPSLKAHFGIVPAPPDEVEEDPASG